MDHERAPPHLPKVDTYRELIDLALAQGASFSLMLPSMMAAMYQMTMCVALALSVHAGASCVH
jgi:hypothetical protein